MHSASGLLDDVDGVEIAAALEAEDGVDGDLSEVLLVLGEDLRRERRPRNVEEVLLELLCRQRHAGELTS